MQTMFRDGFYSRTKYLTELLLASLEYEDETLGGFITFDKFRQFLTPNYCSGLLPFDILFNFI